MLWRTFFNTDYAEFSSHESMSGQPIDDDAWRPAKVSVCEVTENNRWLVVTLEADNTPVVWRVLKDGWLLLCDERALSMSMQLVDCNTLVTKVEKVRFRTRQEFWAFVGHVSFARLHAQGSNRWAPMATYQFTSEGEMVVTPGSNVH
ncbi:hypothetical protein OH77DRAFT_1594435 [Trametes cingulata]|nr:hypothetical protein OH77DRAFT_1594435 [Trametes cingulata]